MEAFLISISTLVVNRYTLAHDLIGIQTNLLGNGGWCRNTVPVTPICDGIGSIDIARIRRSVANIGGYTVAPVFADGVGPMIEPDVTARSGHGGGMWKRRGWGEEGKRGEKRKQGKGGNLIS